MTTYRMWNHTVETTTINIVKAKGPHDLEC